MIYISEITLMVHLMEHCNDGNTVRAERKRQEGHIVKVTGRADRVIVGTFQREKNFGFVIPDDPKLPGDIYIKHENSLGAVTGTKVIVTLTDYGSADKNMEGMITGTPRQYK